MFDNGKFINVAGASLFVSEAGKVDGDPIILLHGGLGSRTDFLPLAKYLATDYRLIAIDSRGHGRSELGNVPYLTYHKLEQDFTEILTELKLTHAGIIGHSDGGIVALRVAASGKIPLRFVIAVGAHWQLLDNDPCRKIYQKMTESMWREKFPEQVQKYETENPSPNFSELFKATNAMWLGNAYPGKTVCSITCPLLIVHGDEDFLVSRAQAFDLAEQVKGSSLLNLPFASHTVLQDNPEDVFSSFKVFLSSVIIK